MAKKAVKKSVKKTTTSKKTTTTPVTTSSVSVPAEVKTTTSKKVVNQDDVLKKMSEEFDQLLAVVSSLKTQLGLVTKQLRECKKHSERELRTALKQAKKKRKSGNRAPSGFVKPTRISDNLADFLSKPKGTELARTEVTREINAYIRKHHLQDPQNGRRILPDAKLRKLLGLKKDDDLTYFNLQKYMSPHFYKQTKNVKSA
tara:strand:- start:447 stop:1049 length:603 start_codon:yes stop_codon:yes gene_type:complete